MTPRAPESLPSISRYPWQITLNPNGSIPNPDWPGVIAAGAAQRSAAALEEILLYLRSIHAEILFLTRPAREEERRGRAERRAAERAARPAAEPLPDFVGPPLPLHFPVSALNPPVRVRKALMKLGAVTVGNVLRLTEDDFIEVKNFGPGSLQMLKDCLAAHGHRLADPGDRPPAPGPAPIMLGDTA